MYSVGILKLLNLFSKIVQMLIRGKKLLNSFNNNDDNNKST